MKVSILFSNFKHYALLTLLIFLSACSSPPKPGNPPNFANANIYINQIAFDVQAPKHAVIALPIGETASRFMVYQGANIVFQDKLKSEPTFTTWG
jgi:hypothetical protein